MLGWSVVIDYTNWRGVRRKRSVTPKEIKFGHHDPYHPVNQWLLYAEDHEDGKVKAFAMQDIHEWRPL